AGHRLSRCAFSVCRSSFFCRFSYTVWVATSPVPFSPLRRPHPPASLVFRIAILFRSPFGRESQLRLPWCFSSSRQHPQGSNGSLSLPDCSPLFHFSYGMIRPRTRLCRFLFSRPRGVLCEALPFRERT